MKNKLELQSNDINISAILHVQAKKIGKIIAMTMIVPLVIGYFVLLFSIDYENNGGAVLGLFVAGIFMVMFPLKFLFWNLWGAEIITISSKAITCEHDYGFFRSNKSNFKIDGIGTDIEIIRELSEYNTGRINFYNYPKETDLPEHIYSTSVLLEESELLRFENEIHNLLKEQAKHEELMDVSLN